jgi:hypothetical protein
MRVMIYLCAAGLLAMAAGCSKNNANRDATEGTTAPMEQPSTTPAPPSDTAPPSDSTAMPPADTAPGVDSSRPPDDGTTPPSTSPPSQ